MYKESRVEYKSPWLLIDMVLYTAVPTKHHIIPNLNRSPHINSTMSSTLQLEHLEHEDSDDVYTSTAVELAALSDEATIQAPTKENIPLLKRINSLLLPVVYPESFYKNILDEPESGILTRLAFWNTQCVGGVRCRLEYVDDTAENTTPSTATHETSKMESIERRVYIMTLAVLAPYRSLSIGSHLVDYICNASKSDEIKAQQVYAHVWVANTEALEFYRKRGFDVTSGTTVTGYYRRLKPDAAKVVFKNV